MSDRLKWCLAFAAVFAAGAFAVFYGTWSLDVVPIMPDDAMFHPGTYADFVARWWDKLVREWRLHPAEPLFGGLIISPYFCQELKYAVAWFSAATALAWFLRGRGLTLPAALSGGLFLGFCGYWTTLFSAGHAGWFQWMTTGVFAFGFVDRAVRFNRLRYWLGLALCVAWAGYFQQDLWLLFTLFTIAYFIRSCWRERRIPWRGALLAAAVFLVVDIPGIRESLKAVAGREKQIEESKGGALTGGKAGEKGEDKAARWIFVTNWSLPLDETAEFLVPRLNGDTSCPLSLSIAATQGQDLKPYTGALGRPIEAKSGNYRQHSLYVGFITCLFALLGIVFHRRDREVWFFATAALVTYLLSLGRYCEPVYRLIFALPVGDLIRCPVKWHHLTEFSLCVLAGFGVEAALDFAKRFGKGGSIAVLAVVLLGVADLVYHDSKYCVPLDVRRARELKCGAELTVLRRQDFQNPQVAEMVRRGLIVSVANYLGNPDLFLVEVLNQKSSKR